MPDKLDRHEVERLRRSIVMLYPGQVAGLKREEAMRLLAELQRLQSSDRRLVELITTLRRLVEENMRTDDAT